MPATLFDQGVTRKELLGAVASRIRDYLAPTIAEVRARKEKQLVDFAASGSRSSAHLWNAKRSLTTCRRSRTAQIELVLYGAKIDGGTELQQLVETIKAKRPSIEQVAHHSRRLIDKFVQRPTAIMCPRWRNTFAPAGRHRCAEGPPSDGRSR